MPRLTMKQRIMVALEHAIFVTLIVEYKMGKRDRITLLSSPKVRHLVKLYRRAESLRYVLPRAYRLRPIDKFALDLKLTPAEDGHVWGGENRFRRDRSPSGCQDKSSRRNLNNNQPLL